MPSWRQPVRTLAATAAAIVQASYRRLHLVVLIAVFVAVASLQAAPAFRSLEHVLAAARMRAMPIEASGRYVFLAIDSRSLHSLGIWPWPREVYAAIVRTLMQAGATEVYLDLDLSAGSTAEGDAALAEALSDAGGSVILPVFRQQRGLGARRLSENAPLPKFREHAWLGVVNVPVDRDGMVRRYPYGMIVDGTEVPSVASLLSGVFGPPGTDFRINFGIRPDSVPSVSVIDLLRGRAQVDFAGRSVILGAHALELRSTFAVPVHGILPGALVQILATETLHQDVSLRRLDAWPLLLAVGVACMALAATVRGRMPAVVATVLAASAAIEALALWAHVAHALVVPTAALHMMLLATAVVAAARELDLRRLLLQGVRVEKLNTERILERVIADSSDAILIVDEELRVLRISRTVRTLFGAKGDAGGRLLGEIVPAEIVEHAREALASLQAGTPVRTATRELSFRRNGDIRHLEYAITPSRLWEMARGSCAAEGACVVCISARDVTVDREQRLELDRLARFDALTGALNRTEFVERLSAQIAETGAGCAVIAFDLHRFQTINSTLGRDVGDALLVALVRRIDEADLGVSPMARLGGDRFAVFTTRPATATDADAVADRLVTLAGSPFDLGGRTARSGVRIGVASGAPADGAESLLSKAEHALDETRLRSGPDRRTFDEATFANQARARQIERGYWTALAEDQMYLAYQPQVRLSDGALLGAEALARWQHPELGPLPPSEFIAVAENSGFIEHLGRWVLAVACRDAANWPMALSVSVNVSPAQFRRSDVVADVERALDDAGLSAHRLTLEITESIFLGGIGELDETLHRLRSLGVSLALDDFGSGFSSFGYLPRLPLDTLKLDRMFVEGLASDPYSEAVIRSVVPLCRELDLGLVCEGVETLAQSDMLKALGCDNVQGFFYGRPEPQEAFLERIRQSRQFAESQVRDRRRVSRG